jgi:hypothetical protein
MVVVDYIPSIGLFSIKFNTFFFRWRHGFVQAIASESNYFCSSCEAHHRPPRILPATQLTPPASQNLPA